MNGFNLAAHVLTHHPRDPAKIALAIVSPTGAERWSFAALERAVRGTAAGLLARNLPPGARVLLRMGNSVDFPIAYLGAIAAGLVPVPSSAQLTESEITPMAAAIEPSLVLWDGDAALPQSGAPVVDLPAFRGMRDLPPADFALGDPERPAYAIFTSGSSGTPRAVVHAHRAVLARAIMHREWMDIGTDDRLMHAGAFNWTYTLGTGLMDPWTLGATALIPAPGVSVAQLPLLMKRHDVTLFAAAPGVFRQLLRAPIPRMPRLRHALSAGEKLPESIRAGWEEATGTPVHEAFGMSECSTFISGSPGRPAPAGALGFPQTGRRIAVLGEDGPAAQGEAGVLAVHHSDPGLMLGYWKAAEETAARFRDGWFLTGDIVTERADGALVYEGRDDDMMNAGGYRVSPLELEAALSAFPGIGDVAAVEVRIKPDTTVIAAFHTGDVDAEALAAHLAGRLARYKQPRLFRKVEAIPLNPNGKVARRRLREAWAGFHPA
jgi:acyl-coenzyme A synthetase/AMP-(fatty) acid ligase